ncbi:MAG TPA: hypothetical protein VEI55_05280 [Candidatus Acidoferrum sp.]|jgi:hypothetical protein|nr:hypothetical protein [Candidatus Acidoferrum sp.]
MRLKILGLCLAFLLGGSLCSAQQNPAAKQIDRNTVYCSGFVADHKLPSESYVISGEQSSDKLTFSQGDYVYINRGQSQGVHEGDEFLVFRPVEDPVGFLWFDKQSTVIKEMGIVYEDEGRIKVVHTDPKVSIAKVIHGCNYMQRGDLIRPVEERAVPPLKDSAHFDHFAPPSGKGVGTVALITEFAPAGGSSYTAYINIGSSQNLKVGDYVRMFRYQGKTKEYIPTYRNMQYDALDYHVLYGKAPQPYTSKDLPREVLGEGIVLNVSAKSATVLITTASTAIYAGDFVEPE